MNAGLEYAEMVMRVQRDVARQAAQTRGPTRDPHMLNLCPLCGDVLLGEHTAGVLRLQCMGGHFERRIPWREG